MPSKQDVSGFIRAHFRSVWALELLFYLRHNRGQSLTHLAMVMGLRGSDLVVTQGVESLASAGLVAAESDGSARYDPASEDLDRMAERIEVLYRRSPDAVRRLVAGSASLGIAAFADAFRLRKD